MILLVGPSGSGTTHLESLLVTQKNMTRTISYTTRPLRKNEEEGVHYHTLSAEHFIEKAAQDFFAEAVNYQGNHYGTAADDCLPHNVVVVERNGHNQLKEYCAERNIICRSIFIETSEENRRARMLAEGRPVDKVTERIQKDKISFAGVEQCTDYIVNNDGDAMDALEEIWNTISEFVEQQ